MVEIKKGDVVEFRMVVHAESNGLLFGRLLVDNEPDGRGSDSYAVGVAAVVANHGQYVPAIKEPTGLGAVIQTDSGDTWVRFATFVPDRWTNGYDNESWDALIDPAEYGGVVAVRSDGVDV